VSDEPRDAADEMRMLPEAVSEEMGRDLREHIAEAPPASLASEPQLLTLLLSLVESDDDEEGRAVVRDKLDDDGLFLTLLGNARLYNEWWRHLTDLVGNEWLAQRVQALAANEGEFNEDHKQALAHAKRQVAGRAPGSA
jgi:hypothetical protein